MRAVAMAPLTASRPHSRAGVRGKCRAAPVKRVSTAFGSLSARPQRAAAPPSCRAIARPASFAAAYASLSNRPPPSAAAIPGARPKMQPLRAVRADTAEAADAASSSSSSPQLLQAIAEITATVDARVAAALEASAAHAAQAAAEAETAGGKPAAGEGDGVAALSPAAALRARIEASVLKLQKGLLERETEVRLMLLAALCGEHLLLLGPPGTAKSELSRRLSGLLGGRQQKDAGDGDNNGNDGSGCAYFERLLTRFSVPEELFGPLSMRGLENDQYVRQTAGYLPTAEVAFVDEIFKANSAILNALLTLLNERLFDNGSERLAAPLLTLVGASNELPESEELDALYDRFLLRRQVSQVSAASAAGLARLAAGREDHNGAGVAGNDAANANANTPTAQQVVTVDDLRGTAAAARLAVDVPDAVIDLLVGLRAHLQDRCEPPVYVSDRRFMKSVSLLQTAAYGDGRDRVSEYDCLLLEHALGTRPDDARKVRAHVLDTIGSDPGLQQAELVLLGLFGRACALLARAGGDAAADEELAAAAEEAATLAALLEARHAEVSASLDGGFPELRATLWQSASSARQAAQHLTPPLTENRKRAEDLLREARVLHACLEAPAPAGVLERMLPKRYKQFVKGIAGGAAGAGGGGGAGAPSAR